MQVTHTNVEIDIDKPDKVRFSGRVHVSRAEMEGAAAGTMGNQIWCFVETVAAIHAARLFDDTLTTFNVLKDSYIITWMLPIALDTHTCAVSVDVALDKPQKKVKIATESVLLEKPDAEWNF